MSLTILVKLITIVSMSSLSVLSRGLGVTYPEIRMPRVKAEDATDIERPAWAKALFIRRKIDLNMSQEAVVAGSDDRLNQTEVSRLERGRLHPTEDLSMEKFGSYLKALRLNLETFTELTGLEVPERFIVTARPAPQARHVPSSLRTLPTYRLKVPRTGKGERVRMEDSLLPLEEGLEGDFEIYRLEEEGLESTTYLVRKQAYARAGHIAICDVPEKGTVAATVKSIQGKLYILETSSETFVTEKITIRGVAVYKYERLEEPPNGVN